MFREIAFYCLLYLLGLSVTVSFRKERCDLLLISLMAFPMGLALWIFGVVYSLILPIRANLFSISIIIVLLIITGYKYFKIKGETRLKLKEIIQLIMGFLVFGIAAAVITEHNAVNTSPDSFLYILHGNYIGEYGEFSKVLPGIKNTMIAVPAVLSASVFLKNDYLGNIFPVLSLTFLGLFGYFLWKSMEPYNIKTIFKTGLTILGVLMLGTTYNYVYHSFYVGTVLFASVYFLIAFLAMCMYQNEKKMCWILISSVSLSVFLLTRRETLLFSSVVLMLYFLQIERKEEGILYLLPFSMLAYPWYIFVIHFQRGDLLLSVGQIIIIPSIFMASITIKETYFKIIQKYLLKSGLLFISAVTIIGVLLKPGNAWNILRMYGLLIFKTGKWGFVFPAMLVFFIICLISKNKIEGYIENGVCYYALFLFFTYLFFYKAFQEAYIKNPDWFFSANRLLLGGFPLLIMSAVLNLAQLNKNSER